MPPLRQFQGQVLLIVNTASACGFAPVRGAGAAAPALWRTRPGGAGLSCDQFGHQDPGSDAQIAGFCQLHYGVSFTMMGKIEVNGAGAHPLYRWLCAQAPGLLGSRRIKWNFTKFLLGATAGCCGAMRPR
jgi:glutathione peroxidase